MVNLSTPRSFPRRELLAGMLAVALPLAAQEEPMALTVSLDPAQELGRIAPDFLGFGYEVSAVAQPGYFSAGNATLVRLYGNLGTSGLVRIGGNISDHTRYVPDGTPQARTEREVTVITHASLVDLGGFLAATGWRVMWGLNLGTGSRQEAVAEAQAVAEIAKGRLQSFEIGNEVDLHSGFTTPLQTYEQYHAAYVDYRDAIRAALPGAPFSGPDTASNLEYVASFAASEGRDAQLLTTHYYRTGANRPDATIATLLREDGHWQRQLQSLQQLGRDHGIGYRINEVNSFHGGGKAGVSDTFAAALWCLDYLYVLAAHGCAGINLQTDINQHAFISHYSPIVHDAAGRCSARPEYVALLAFAMAGRGALLACHLERSGGDAAAPPANVTAYATRADTGVLYATVINKELARDAAIRLALPAGYARVAAFRMAAPAIDSTGEATFAGRAVATDGSWAAGPAEPVAVTGGSAAIEVPHASAVVLRLER